MPVTVMHVGPVDVVMGELSMVMEMVMGLFVRGKSVMAVPVMFVMDMFVPMGLDNVLMQVGMRFSEK